MTCPLNYNLEQCSSNDYGLTCDTCEHTKNLKRKIYISNLKTLPTNCKACPIRGINVASWVCGLLPWKHNLPIYQQAVDVTEKDWYDGKWKHPDCPLREG
jgi:hypothetical protein